jgi:hypothetical protein
LVPLAAALGSFEVRGGSVTIRVVAEGTGSLTQDELRALVEDFRGAPAAGRPVGDPGSGGGEP